MARDLDFSPRRRVVQPVNKPEVNQVPAVKVSKNSPVWLWIVIVTLIAVGAVAIWQFTRVSNPAPVTITPTATQPPLTTNNTDSTPDNLFSPQTSNPTIQIYDSGSGSDAVKALMAKLKALGYTTENLDKSQFNYDKTYIWYRTGLLAEAQKIQSTMPERTTSLQETKIAGSFDILILLGVK